VLENTIINLIEFCCIISVVKNISPKIMKLFVNINYVNLCLYKEFQADFDQVNLFN
jgi:hypothetical protein